MKYGRPSGVSGAHAADHSTALQEMCGRVMKASLRWISLFSCLAGGAAFAGETDDSSGSFDHSVATVSNAFELTVGAGFTQGTGDISHFGANVADISGAGGTVEIKAAYRMTPNFAFGAYGPIAKFTKADLADGTDVYGTTAGLYADWHFRPDRSIDPVISLSSGYRGMWLSPRVGENTSLAGWEIARLQVS